MPNATSCVPQQDVNGRCVIEAPPTSSSLPSDAVAVIYRSARSAMTSGFRNTRQWKLRFERRTAPFIEPLMGWTGGEDTLCQVELTFPSAEAAIAYARRQGLTFVVHGVEQSKKDRRPSLQPRQSQNRATAVSKGLDRTKCELETNAARAATGNELTSINPTARYAHPSDVLRDPTLSAREKHDILQRSALEAYRRETDVAERVQSQLDNIIDALIDLDSGEPLAVLTKRADMQRFGSRTEGKAAA
jgi:hypothetical protein